MPKKPDLPNVPGYEILGELGQGSMGVVYRARQIQLNRIVALKMLVTGGHVASLARARTEAESVAHLQHPNIVQIFEVQEHDNAVFFAFEYVESGALDTTTIKTPREAAQLIETLARGVQYAHQRGVVHRDLKPDNVLLTTDGTPKIADFGLAKRLEIDSGQTVDGAVMGTPQYMSPEQATGKSANVGPASDIFSLGCILYQLLVGKPPFDDNDLVQILRNIRNAAPVRPSKINHRIHVDLETICLKSLEKQPANRYPSAEAFADDLRRFLDGETILAKPTPVLIRSARWVRKRAFASAISVLLLITTTLAIIFAVVTARDARTQSTLRARTPIDIDRPQGLPTFSVPSDNPVTMGKVELGKQLFFDPRLSRDNTVSCADCHQPVRGWSDPRAISRGVDNQPGSRNSQTILNVAYSHFLFWDGRATSLEEQSLMPLTNPTEMGVESLDDLVAELKAIDGYRKQFQQVFDDGVTSVNIGAAIAAFQRTLVAGDAPYDRYARGNKEALSDVAKRGHDLFFGKAHCSACHSGPLFSDGGFHNTGIGLPRDMPDNGRFKVTGRRGDRGSFKTPSLRDIGSTAPYMHNGEMKTLMEVIDFYDRGGNANPQLDEEMFPLHLTDQEKQDLLEFLKTGLTSKHFPGIEPPELPR